MKVTKKKWGVILTLIIVIGIFAYGYTQYLQKGAISTVLQYQIDLSNPPDLIFAVSTFDQKLPDGKTLPKGTRFIGMLSKSKEENNFIIYFDTIQNTSGEKTRFAAKSILKVSEESKQTGISAKISKTLYQQTKTNVLGAIFNTSSNIQPQGGTILPRGYTLRIEVN